MSAAISRFTTTDRVDVSYHARRRWQERAAVEYPVEDAWREAEPLTWPGTFNALYARYHPDSGLLLIAQRDVLVTAWPVPFVQEGRDQLAEDLNRIGRMQGGGSA